jgi:2-isopropylmalate synthase
LCDTNGGTVPMRLVEIVSEVRSRFDGILGIHTHNDSDLAVANTLVAVEAGVTHVQGCMNGYGERTGNANLCSIIANLELKLGHTTIGPEKLKQLTNTARLIADLANLPLRREQPFVGPSAFAHKGGIHVSAVLKDSSTYEHIRPDLVGNRQRVLLSDLSGRSNVTYKLNQLSVGQDMSEAARRDLLERMKQMEHLGYDFETAEGTFELLVRQAARPDFHPFEVLTYEVTTRLQDETSADAASPETLSSASVTLRIGGKARTSIAEGHEGPVHALDMALRQCLSSDYPTIAAVRLTDYKVRVLGMKGGTESRVRVLVEWSDHRQSWTTVGISNNVIDASWHAMVDALRLELMRLADEKPSESTVVNQTR